MNETDSLIIKKVTEQDIPKLLEFIKGIAEYEKMADEVTATEDDLHQSLFSENSSVEALFGYYRGEPVCYAIYFFNFSSFTGRRGLYLEDLFVSPDMRGKGFGKKMLIHLAGIAKDNECPRFEWAVLDWNEPAIKFYKSLGAFPMEGWTVFRMTGDTIKKLAESS